MQSTTTTVTASDGTALSTHRWLPDGPPKAVVQISHGMAEHEYPAMLAMIGLFYLLREHVTHGARLLPYLILLLCPLLHLFGHRHGGHDGDR